MSNVLEDAQSGRKKDKLEAVSFYVENGAFMVDCPTCGQKNNVNAERGVVNTCRFCQAKFILGDMIRRE